jgi:murein DD-endopeptidase MepM/ murein hydrolase activator NlpD
LRVDEEENEMEIIAPVPGLITSPFGVPRVGHDHQGVDFQASTGTPIAAVAYGQVFKAGQISSNAGLGVEIAHPDGVVTKYFHMSSVLASVGQAVEQGQTIGLVGATGNAKGPHLHFEIWIDGAPIDPSPYLSGASLPGGTDASSSTSINPSLYPYADFSPDTTSGIGMGGVAVAIVAVVVLVLILDL